MSKYSAADPPHIHVSSERDVITIRQEVREVARSLGLELAQQARITAAVSTVARALLSEHMQVAFHIRTVNHAMHPGIEVACMVWDLDATDEGSGSELDKELEEAVHFDEARALVDEAHLARDGQEAHLSLLIASAD